ncbi:MAG: FtsX-like permease family protein, partial [Fulvivirga sp.]|nr:FtsX-like permease family protein [Fulvivirga sp.]
RKAELGIRKVFGASIWQLTSKFLKQFVVLVLIAFIISAPVCWYIIDMWLDRFAYKININPFPFFVGGIMVLFIAVGTVSFNTVRAAMVNPAKILRQE